MNMNSLTSLSSLVLLSGPAAVAVRVILWALVLVGLFGLCDFLGAQQLAQWEIRPYAELCAGGMESACSPAATLARWGLGAGL